VSTETPTVPRKQLEQRVTYRLLVTNEKHPEKDKKQKAVFCTYNNGVRLYGKTHPTHPEILVRKKDQDEVLWTGPEPFRVEFRLPGSDNEVDGPFYRTEWIAAKGADGVYRLVSGPVRHEIENAKYKFVIIARIVEGQDEQGKDKEKDDPDSEPLDPHIIIEP